MEEKRRYRRLNKSFITKFRISPDQNPKESLPDPLRWDIVTMRNISGSGICFIYNKPIAEGMILEFDIMIASLQKGIHCLGTVCRVDHPRGSKPGMKLISLYGIAVHFMYIDPRDQEAIDKVVAAFSGA